MVKALEKVIFNPCTRKSANMGHPSRERGLVGNRKSRGGNDCQHPNRSKVVHCSLNLTQASRPLGMTILCKVKYFSLKLSRARQNCHPDRSEA